MVVTGVHWAKRIMGLTRSAESNDRTLALPLPGHPRLPQRCYLPGNGVRLTVELKRYLYTHNRFDRAASGSFGGGVTWGRFRQAKVSR